ncbi:MAG TPA: beta-N-acetylhexosaminidase [Vicinamibacteria bacterium]|nr:beta-N-acetylhexosaminidase [Vicinamibacteria bacterium]
MREAVRKVGQRFMAGFHGHTASPEARMLIRDFGVGHVVLFARNVDTPGQVADLVRELQSIARDAGHAVPLLVAVDQEGGRVARLREPWTVWPAPRLVGRAGSEELARRQGAALAAELAACGIRLDFAPVVDLDTNPQSPVIGDRSFGPEPDAVGRLGAALVRGLQENGVAACAKHFIGQGDTEVDPHLDLPFLHHARARLEDRELRPFAAAIEAGVAGVMTAHVVLTDLDDDLPATLSPRVVKDLVRDRLGFEGVVFSDDMEMHALAKRWQPGESAVLAARAGCDVVEYCADHEQQVDALEGLIRAVESEQIPWTDLDESGERIRRLKHRYLVPHRDPDSRRAREAAGAGEHQAVAREIAARAGEVV